MVIAARFGVLCSLAFGIFVGACGGESEAPGPVRNEPIPTELIPRGHENEHLKCEKDADCALTVPDGKCCAATPTAYSRAFIAELDAHRMAICAGVQCPDYAESEYEFEAVCKIGRCYPRKFKPGLSDDPIGVLDL